MQYDSVLLVSQKSDEPVKRDKKHNKRSAAPVDVDRLLQGARRESKIDVPAFRDINKNFLQMEREIGKRLAKAVSGKTAGDSGKNTG